MYYGGYYGAFWDPTYILVVIGMIICLLASARVKSTYAGLAALPQPRTSSFRKYFIPCPLFTTPANSLIMVLCNFMPTYV